MKWPKDSQDELIRFYGRPGREVEKRLVHVTPPFKMYYGDKQVKSLLFHEEAADALALALNEVWDRCGRDQAKVDKLGISKTAGTYNPRKISGSDRWSNHAFGGAIDINAEEKGFGKGKGTIPPVLVEAFDNVGFRWGGRYKGRTDPMHFEACGGGQMPAKASFLGFDALFERFAGEDHVKGCTFFDATETSSEHDEHDDAPHTTQRAPWWKRLWLRWTGGSVATYLGLAQWQDWQIAAVMMGGVLFFVAAAVYATMRFIGADGRDAIRQWVIRQFKD